MHPIQSRSNLYFTEAFMPTTIPHGTENKKRRDEPGIGGQPPVARRPTGGNGDGGDDDNWGNERHGPRELLLRVRFFLFTGLAVDLSFFGVLTAILFARAMGAQMEAHSPGLSGNWQPLPLPPILYLDAAVLLLSCLTVEIARRNIFREIDALEEWLGLGQPALARALPWLGATLGLGALFLAGQWIACKQLAAQGFAYGLNSNPAGTIFYFITGLHSAHLLLGVLALMVCLTALGWLQRVELRQIAVDATAWYWHSISLVWLVLLGMLALGK
jgi:cytochrome c oxidase subunit 3